MKHILYTIPFIFFTSTIISQSNIKQHKILLLSSDNKPIENAYMISKSKDFGIMSDKNGFFAIDMVELDSVFSFTISHTSYETYSAKYDLKTLSSIDTIFLTPKMHSLPEIIIGSKELKDYLNKINDNIDSNYGKLVLNQLGEIQSNYSSKFLDFSVSADVVLITNLEKTSNDKLYFKNSMKSQKIKDSTYEDFGLDFLRYTHVFNFLNQKELLRILLTLEEKKYLILNKIYLQELDSNEIIVLDLYMNSLENQGTLKLSFLKKSYCIINYELNTKRKSKEQSQKIKQNGKTVNVFIRPSEQHVKITYRPYKNNKWCLQEMIAELTTETRIEDDKKINYKTFYNDVLVTSKVVPTFSKKEYKRFNENSNFYLQ